MRLNSHSDAVNLVREHLSKQGFVSLKFTTGRFRTMDDNSPRIIDVGHPGASDIIALPYGLFFGIEVKISDSDRQRKEQKTFQEVVEKAGGTYVLADFRRGGNGLAIVDAAIKSKMTRMMSNVGGTLCDLGVPKADIVACQVMTRLLP